MENNNINSTNNNDYNPIQKIEIQYSQEHVDQLHGTIREQLEQINELNNQSRFRKEDAERWQNRYEQERVKKSRILMTVRELFEEMLEDDDDVLDTYSSKYEELVALGMEGFTKQVEFTISYIVRVSGTAKVPYGSDFSDYDDSYIDITVDEDNFSGQLIDECEEIDLEIEVEERSMARSWDVTNG